MRKRRRSGKEMGVLDWMTTYSDMVTLLLTFFILLYSFSVLDVVKFKAFVTSFQGSGVLNWSTSPLEETDPRDSQQPNEVSATPSQQDSLSLDHVNEINPLLEAYFTVQAFLQESGLENLVEVRYEDRGIALDIKERVLFDSGKADLRPEAKRLLDTLSVLLAKLPYQISVEGHTDNRRINTQEFPSNWELSVGRAVKVVRYLVEQQGLDPRKFAAVGYGEYQPVVPNTSLDNMALNRRVVIMIIARNPFENPLSQ
ncbi:MAG: OmpA family protein [Bacillota bacterium]